MNSVQFGNYDSYDDFSLFLASKEIGTAEPKKKIVEVEGSDGVLDFTEYFGDVKYNNRTLKMDFSLIHSDLLGQYSFIQDAIHGKKMHISFSEDSGFYYDGRITVEPFTKEKNIGRFSITADCDPYKYKTSETIMQKVVSNTNSESVLSNLLNMQGWQGGISSGITYTVNSNGSITLNGTCDENGMWLTFYDNFPTLTSGQKYSYLIKNNQPEGLWTGISGSEQHSIDDGSNYVTFTADGEESFLYIWINANTVIDNYTFFPALYHGEVVNLTNSRKHVVPTITTSDEMNFFFNNVSTSSSAGTFKIPSLELSEGNNIVVVNGSGTVSFKYREGRL